MRLDDAANGVRVTPAPPVPALSLQRQALPELTRLDVPSYRSEDLSTGVVHLGLGSFARAHVATYFDRIAELGVSRAWGMAGAGLRSARPAAALAAQDNLWTVVQGDQVRVVGALTRYHAGRPNQSVLLETLCRPSVRLVTLTMTATAYDAAPESGGALAFRLLAAALAGRQAAGTPPFTVLSCDNLPDNGQAARRALLAAADVVQPGLSATLARTVAFPSCMVDRITPTTSDVRRRALARSHLVLDQLPLFPERHSRWVVSDELGEAAAPLREVGVQTVRDVRPHVEAKTRLLNGAHVALAYLSDESAPSTCAAAVADPHVARLLLELLRDEVEPTLRGWFSRGELAAQRNEVLDRLADPSVDDTLERLRLRGSVRVGNYVVPTLRDALRQGTPSLQLTRILAAWTARLQMIGETDPAGESLEDPLAERLIPLARRAADDPRPLLAVSEVFADLGQDPRFVAAFRHELCQTTEDSRAAAS